VFTVVVAVAQFLESRT